MTDSIEGIGCPAAVIAGTLVADVLVAAALAALGVDRAGTCRSLGCGRIVRIVALMIGAAWLSLAGAQE